MEPVFIEFNNQVFKYTLRFRSEQIEAEYRDPGRHAQYTVKTFKVIFIILIFLFVFRRIQNFFMSRAEVTSNAGPADSVVINLIGLGIVTALEIPIYFISKLKPVKGFFFMVYAFFYISFESYCKSPKTLNLSFSYIIDSCNR